MSVFPISSAPDEAGFLFAAADYFDVRDKLAAARFRRLAASMTRGDGTPGPAREDAEPSETAKQLAERWRQEAKDHPVRRAGDLLLLCAIELESVLASGDSGGPREALRAAKEIAFDWLHTDPDDPAGPVMTRVHDAKAGWEAMRRIYDILDAALRAELGRAGSEGAT